MELNANLDINSKKTDGGGYFHREMKPGLYLISYNDDANIDSAQIEIKPGPPTPNSWLVVGNKKALLVDSAAPAPGLRKYAEKLAGVPLMLIISHCHYDHVYRLCEFDEFWVHPEDAPLLNDKSKEFSYYNAVPKRINYVNDGDVIKLGNRNVRVIHTPGHTYGSIVLFDQASKTLISGDTVARRLLYMGGILSTKWVPLGNFIGTLKSLQALEFDYIASAHDRFLIDKTHIEHMLTGFELIRDNKIFFNEHGVNGLLIRQGDENKEEYFDAVFPLEQYEELIQDLDDNLAAMEQI